MEKNGFFRAVRRLRSFLRATAALRIPFHAAGAGYFIILAAFPSLVLLLGLLQLTGLTPEQLPELVQGLLPAALRDPVRALMAGVRSRSSGGAVGISAAASLWSAGRGIYGLTEGLNRVYEVRETRGWLATRLRCAAYTFILYLVLLLMLAVRLLGNTLLTQLAPEAGGWDGPEFLLTAALQTGLFTLMYMVLPGRRSGFRENLPGAVLACGGWRLFSLLYSLCTERFASRQGGWEPVYPAAMGMLWLYCCLSILLYGGALNRQLQSTGEK